MRPFACSIESYFGEPTSAAGYKPPVRNLLGMMDKIDYNERGKFDPTRSFHIGHFSKGKKYDPVVLFALNGFLEGWNTGRALDCNPRSCSQSLWTVWQNTQPPPARENM